MHASRGVALALGVALLAASCSSGGKSEEPAAVPSPSSTVKVPGTVELTALGEELEFGETATVIHEPDQNTGTVLTLTVKRAVKGSVEDFSGFILDEYTKTATPYYVMVDAENVGEGTVGGSAVPLWGVDGDNTLLPPASFTTTFNRCPSEPLPEKFAPGDSFSTCLVFLAPDQGTMRAVSFRPNQEFHPIEWTGEVETPSPTPSPSPGRKKSKRG